MNPSSPLQALSYYRRQLTRHILCAWSNRFPKAEPRNLVELHREQQAHWDGLVGEGDAGAMQRGFERKARVKLDLLEAAPLRVLEIGCDGGWFGGMLRDKFPGVHYVGIDFRPETNAGRTRPGISLLAADGLQLPFSGGSFELLIAFHVLEHIRDVAGFRAEIRRVLEPGGHLVLCVPLGWDTDPCHRWHFMTPGGWRRFLNNRLGLRVLREALDEETPAEYLAICRFES